MKRKLSRVVLSVSAEFLPSDAPDLRSPAHKVLDAITLVFSGLGFTSAMLFLATM